MSSKTSNYGAVATGAEEPFAKVDTMDDPAQPVFRDVPFAVAFFLHLGVMIALGVKYGSFEVEGMQDMDQDATTNADDDFQIDEEHVELYVQRIMLKLVLPSAVIAFVLGLISTGFVIPACPKQMVSASLLGSVAWTVVIAIMIMSAASSIFAYLGAMFLVGITIFYVTIVWKLIPFAAANLGFALKGLTANWGMYLVAMLFSAIGFVWVTIWLYVTIGITSTENEEPEHKTHKHADDDYEDEDEEGAQVFVWFLLLVSLYWTSVVITNTVQVTVAGVIGTYCFAREEALSCCSPAVTSSLYRSVTYAFGSICFGSLLQALITALRILVENARDQARRDNDGGFGTILLCLLECIMRLLEDIIEYFNQWAYVFVGIYGFSYLDSGRRVIELFRARGWTAIITNDLVGWVLNFTALTVSIVTGLIAMAVEKDDWDGNSYFFGSLPGPKYWAFGVGFLMGMIVSSVMMSVAKGAVNTLIVCFADAPAKLEENHAEETRKMAEAWISVFPDCGVHPHYSVVV